MKGQIDPGGPPRVRRQRRVLRIMYIMTAAAGRIKFHTRALERPASRSRANRKYVCKFAIHICQTSFRFDMLTMKLFLYTKIFEKLDVSS